MSKVLAIAGSILVAGSADAGPTVRLGITDALADQTAPGKNEIGPMIGLGLRAGRFVGELEWAYLSFFDPDTTEHGVQRLGVSLRADLTPAASATYCKYRYGCTRASSIWGEVGAGERFGQWHLDASHTAPASPREPEAHVSIGFELDNQIRPMRNGWQLGLRFAISPRGADLDVSDCRTSGGTCTMTTNNGGVDGSVLAEWAFLFGD